MEFSNRLSLGTFGKDSDLRAYRTKLTYNVSTRGDLVTYNVSSRSESSMTYHMVENVWGRKLQQTVWKSGFHRKNLRGVLVYLMYAYGIPHPKISTRVTSPKTTKFAKVFSLKSLRL